MIVRGELTKTMSNKKFGAGIIVTLAVLTLAGCNGQTKTNSSSKSATASSQSVKSAHKKQTTKTSHITVKQSSSNKQSKPKKVKVMNLTQIKKGDYSSLLGNWTQIGYQSPMLAERPGMRVIEGGTGSLNISKNTITSDSISIRDQALTDNAGSHNLSFQTKDNVLTANLNDQSVAINWSVTFYPKGTTNDFKTASGPIGNNQNIIAIWTSNNNYTEIFTQNATKQVAATTKANLNLDQLAQNDFSSLVGTWKNAHDGKTIVVTDKTMDKPADSTAYYSKGAVVSGADNNSYPEVITSGEVTNGYMTSGIGTFDPSAGPFTPLLIVPQNIKLPDAASLYGTDDSDDTRDRLILGGGQSGVGTQAYYKE